MTRRAVAAHPAPCPLCPNWIEVGDPIAHIDDTGWVHADHPAAAPPRPTLPPCPTCWTIPATNGACGCA